MITIIGSGFRNFEYMPTCRFGSENSTAYTVSDTKLVCRAPTTDQVNATRESSGSLPVPVQVSMNSQDYTQTLVTFRYIQMPTVMSTSPQGGPTYGNTSVLSASQRMHVL